jgi:hypothetical protein
VIWHHEICTLRATIFPKASRHAADYVFMLQKELQFSKWMVEHSPDGIAIWRPDAGANTLCPPPSLHHIDPALCDYPPCKEDMDCAFERGKLRPDSAEHCTT